MAISGINENGMKFSMIKDTKKCEYEHKCICIYNFSHPAFLKNHWYFKPWTGKSKLTNKKKENAWYTFKYAL